jgi:hypothetical protein
VAFVLACKGLLGPDAGRRVWLMIRGIDYGHTVGFQPITERQGRMIEVLRRDADIADFQRSLDQIMVLQRGVQILEGDREIDRLHLPGQRLAEGGADAARTIDVPNVTGFEERFKKGKALDVIPMGVADQHVTVKR